MSSDESKALARELKTQIRLLGGAIAIMWILEFVDTIFLGQALNQYGIHPREISGLWGILWMPFLHGGFPHLIANTVPFLTLGWFVMLQDTGDFLFVTVVTTLLGGLGVWLIGASNSVHIGASGLVFGYLGFLISRGFFQRNFMSIALSLFVGFFYGGLIWGILPTHPFISWEGHFCGLVSGAIAAKFLANKR
jgi:membrane associated rhomboid family serine protease